MARIRRILVVEDEESIRFVLTKAISRDGLQVDAVGDVKTAKEKLSQTSYIAHFLDIRLPDGDGVELLSWIKKMEITGANIVMTAEATMQNAVRAVKKGAFEYIVKPFDLREIETIIKRVFQRETIARTAKVDPFQGAGSSSEFEIIGQSPSMQRLYKKIGQAAGSNFTVLVTGESGTGKELVARNIHEFSDRAAKPFLAVNCAATPQELFESELFGHLKGSFTGADSTRKGYLEEADGGTLFMDEIGEINLKTQSKLLRFLEEGSIVPIGGRKPIKTDVRFIAATNRDLKKMVESGEFRDDLFHRLNVIPLKLPTLRNRPGDIELLVEYFLKKFGAGKKISTKALNMLTARRWPGNVRQLQNSIKRAVVASSDDILLASHFPSAEEEAPQEIEPWISHNLQKEDGKIYERVIGQIEAELIRQAVKKCGGNKVKAAKLLGINRNTLSKKYSG